MTPSMTEKLIKQALAPLLERIEKLEKSIKTQSQQEPVGWGGHLPGKIEP